MENTERTSRDFSTGFEIDITSTSLISDTTDLLIFSLAILSTHPHLNTDHLQLRNRLLDLPRYSGIARSSSLGNHRAFAGYSHSGVGWGCGRNRSGNGFYGLDGGRLSLTRQGSSPLQELTLPLFGVLYLFCFAFAAGGLGSRDLSDQGSD